MTPVLLAIGTTHPLNIAGIGLDSRVAGTLGVRLVSVVAGISAQNVGSVLARTAVDAATIRAQFAALDDIPIAAIHVGALVDAQSVVTIAKELQRRPGVPVVCDPVIAATGGDRLADDATIAAVRDVLFAQCALVTPNLAEAGLFLGRQVVDIDGMEAAGRALRAFGPAAVLVKGGHLAGDAVDVLVTADACQHLRSQRIEATLRGTGDLLACAIAARLAHGDDVTTAVTEARAFVHACLRDGVAFAGTWTLPVRY